PENNSVIESPFLVLNGDVYTDIKLNSLTLPEGMLAHLVMVNNPDFHPDGDFQLMDGKISPKEASGNSKALTFSGVSVLSPGLFAGYRAGETLTLAPLLKDAMNQGKVSGQYHDGFWADVGSIVRLQALEEYLQKNHHS
ncbi:MAG: mannose-1-phosphate guanylyltransferase, partial [Endozoicomonas sp.]